MISTERTFLLVLFTILAASAYQLAHGGTSQTGQEMETKKQEGDVHTKTMAAIGSVSVSIPATRFLLVRRGTEYCAVRFTEFHRESNKPGLFSAGDDSLFAEYDWYYQGDGSGDFGRANVQSGHNKLYEKPAVGIPIHPFFWHRGETIVKCGPSRLAWWYPTQVGFHTSNKRQDDVGNELAPTNWKDLQKVKVHDSTLKWYGYDDRH